MKKKIAILGSTGSIGKCLIDIIKKDKKNFEIILLSADENYKELLKQAKTLKVKNLIINNKNSYKKIKNDKISNKIKIYNNFDCYKEIFKKKVDYTMSSISGIEGLKPTIEIVKYTKRVAIANKEAIICGWNLINKELKKNKTNFIPVDSEHFSIWYALKGIDKKIIDKIYLTASGGPFVGQKLSELHNKTPEEALKHPNWDMGAKISVDSATLVNKCFELIEAKHLFSLGPELLDIKIHRQSVIHSMLEFKDGSVEAQMSQPSMIIPLAYGLLGGYSQDIKKDFSLDLLNRNIDLSLEQFPEDRKKLRDITLDVMNSEDNSGLVFATLNDIAVKKFLNKKIKFGAIYNLILDNYYLIDKKEVNSIQELESNRLEILNLIDGK